ncbi:MAG: glycine--tRNA ligase subunit beta [Anaerolineales bacterium]|nr:glycine--tRNA ligase subunit beta [Anaerolineales bacterium]
MKSKSPLTFQSLILRLEKFWADRGCVIWQPYYSQVGAGTMNPATFLRVLGPEPWNVAYVEPSIRPDDGRYGENPNRFQQHYQYQVILKPDPGDPQEVYLESLAALGLNLREHDIRFVEDNWESPALGAWGLGWEVWLDGQEITQFTYFQQAGSLPTEPVSVELTYGLERILIALNNAGGIWDEPWAAGITYGEILRQGEWEHSKYYFELADVERLRALNGLYEAEAQSALAAGLVLPAYDYVLKLSQTFNVLDARGAIGVTERQAAFGRMRGLARQVSEAYLAQRQRLEYPLLKDGGAVSSAAVSGATPPAVDPAALNLDTPQTLLFEIGVEELPAADLDTALVQLRELAPQALAAARLTHGVLTVHGTPRRLALLVEDLAPRQPDAETLVKGPPAKIAYDSGGALTPAAVGFARSKGLSVDALQVREMDGGSYVTGVVRAAGRPAAAVLADLLPGLVAKLQFEKTMRWNATGVAFSRPIRWLVALLGEHVIPFSYAGVLSGRVSRGLRPLGSPAIAIAHAGEYAQKLRAARIEADPAQRRKDILKQVRKLAKDAGGRVADEGVLNEVTNLVERPTALLGSFDAAHLALPRDVLISVMKKHQRYFPVEAADGAALLPHFIAVRNGDSRHLDLVREGNEHVIRARFADAAFFVREDVKQKLEAFRPGLATLTFQKQLGSMLDKAQRLEPLTAALALRLGLSAAEAATAQRAAHLAKADLATQMVVEMTSLQGIMGREYALRSGETPEVAQAIREHYLPGSAGDALPAALPGVAVGLADRLDSLAGLFAAGLAPTGSADPFGLRRAALGVTLLLTGRALDLDLRAALAAAVALLPAAVQPATPEARAQLIEDCVGFIAGRLRAQLLDAGYRHDVVEAVLVVQAANPHRAAQAVAQLAAWTRSPDWATTLAAYARCARITRDQREQHPLTADALAEPAEQTLYAAYQQAAGQPVNTVDEFFAVLLPMIPAISGFFDKVLVMADDPLLRANRLGLLQRVAGLAAGLADFSKLEGF